MKVNASGGIDGSDALMGPKVQANDIRQAAEQFEAIFLRNMLKEMRKTNELFDSKDNPFNSDSVRMMQGFYDDKLCKHPGAAARDRDRGDDCEAVVAQGEMRALPPT